MNAPVSCSQDPGVIGPLVELGRCEGKGDCVRVCPENVFQVRRIDAADYRTLNLLHKLKLRVHGMEVAYTPNADTCRALQPMRERVSRAGDYIAPCRAPPVGNGILPALRDM
jgi:ferredoxin